MEGPKGNAVVAQSGGPTAVINASLCGVIQAALKEPKIERVFGANNGVLGVLGEELFDCGAEDPDTIELLRMTPAAAAGSCRYKLKGLDESGADYERILEVFKAHDVHYFFYIGGNDSMDTADKLRRLAEQSGYELTVMGVPKTIDNDLALTDHCPGYGSTAKYLAAATMEAGLDTEALYTTDTCTILEAMGRNAGWIAGATGLASRSPGQAPNLIYFPEAPVTRERIVSDCQEVLKEFGRIFIVVCEGVRDEAGNYLAEAGGDFATDSFGHKQLGGAAEAMRSIVEKHIGVKARTNKPGTNQRAASHFASQTDADEAWRCGRDAVRHAVSGTSGYMVTLERLGDDPYRCETGLAPLDDVANGEKKVPREWINEAGNHITDTFRAYAEPLIRGELAVRLGTDGLPIYARLRKRLVERKCPPWKK
jgi:6-phosphofructokinase 1